MSTAPIVTDDELLRRAQQRTPQAIPLVRQPQGEADTPPPAITIPDTQSPSAGRSILNAGRVAPAIPLATSRAGRPVMVQTTDRSIPLIQSTGRPASLNDQGVPMMPGTRTGPSNPITGEPEEINSRGIPIRPGIAGLFAREDNIHNAPLRVLAKIGTGLLHGIDVAGSAVAPGITANIPGSTLNEAVRTQGARTEENRRAKLAEEKAQTVETQERVPFMQSEETKNKAAADEAERKAKAPAASSWEPIMSGDKTIAGFRNSKTGELAGPNSPNLTPEMKDILQAAKPLPAKPDTAVQNKENFQHGIGVLRGEGLIGPGDVSDPKKIAGAINGSKLLSSDEKNTMVGYLAANPTPATNVQVHVAEGADAAARKKAGQYYTYNAGTEENPNIVLASGDKVPTGAEAVPVKDLQQFIGEAENANIVTRSFNHLAKDDLSIFDNGAARSILQTALSDEGAKSFGMLVAGTGGSITLPAGLNKFIDTALENHALDEKTGRKLKDYIVDYWAAKDKLLMVQMAMQQGKVGKGNKQFFDAMLAQLPGPGTPDSIAAKRQLADFQETLHGLKGKYPDKYGSYRKESDEPLKHAGEEFAQPTGFAAWKASQGAH